MQALRVRIGSCVLLILAGLCLGVLFHIALVFAVGQIWPKSSWNLWQTQLPFATPVILPSDYPFPEGFVSDPFMRHAVCRFSLESGPTLVEGRTAPIFWLITVFDRNGRIIDGATAQDQREEPFTILLLPSDKEEMLNKETETETDLAESYQTGLSLQASFPDARFIFETEEKEVLLMIRFFVPNSTYTPAVIRSLKSLKCTVLPPEEFSEEEQVQTPPQEIEYTLPKAKN